MTEQELRQAYETQKPVLQQWGEAVTAAVLVKLEKRLGLTRKIEEFLKLPPEPRVKETKSFLAKALHRGKKYRQPLDEITDQVGVRFVVLLLSELKIIAEIIEDCDLWAADKARDFEVEKIERPHHFDYQSVHYIVRSKKQMEYGGVHVPAGISCEVQVRTLLQHAYAELAHELTYKPSLKVDHDVSRQVAKSAALIEATDEIFVRASERMEAASAELKRVHELAAEMYKSLVGMPPVRDLQLCFRLLDPYRDYLPSLTSESLRSFLDKKDFVADKIKERAPISVLFQHPCVLVIYFLIANYPDYVPKQWPADQTHLENFYTDLGISTEGRF